MKGTSLKSPEKVAIFSAEKVLVGVFCSMNQAASVIGVRPSTVRFACIGTTVSCQGWYLRTVGKAEVGISDIGMLSLDDFDTMNGETRTTYSDRGMRKKRTAKATS